MESPKNLASLARLGKAIDFFKSDAVTDPRTAIILLSSALEAMLQEMAVAGGLSYDGRHPVGRILRELRDKNYLPDRVSGHFRAVLDVRNMVTHARSDSPVSLADAHVIKRQTLLIFEWYLQVSVLGPQMPEQIARNYTDIDSPDRPSARGHAFLCHASEDSQVVEQLYDRLENDGLKPWMDKRDLLPGQDWEREIRRAIERADFFVACLSPHSVTKRGFVQKEMQFALDVLGEIPQSQIYLVPVRLEPCSVPDRLRFLHYVDLATDADYNKLLRTLQGKGHS